MKKVLALVLVLAMGLSVLTACGGSGAGTAATTGTTASDTAASAAESTEDMPVVAATFANMLAEDHPQSIAAKQVLAKEVSDATDGKFTINVQVNGALGNDAETVEATIMGTMTMTGTAAATLANIDPNWYILDVPYVFTSKEQARNALDGELGQFLSDSLEKTAGLICLGYGESGMRNLSNNKREVTSVADMSGMKIRVLENKYHLATFEALGTNPTAMSFSEVYTALQTGQIDGQDNPITITCTNKFYEVQGYYTLTEHLFCVNTYCVNAAWFNALPPAYQEALRTAVTHAVAEQRRLIDENETAYVQEMESNNCKVTTLTAEQKQEFVDATQSVRDAFAAEFGEAGQTMLDLAAKYAQ